MQRRLESVMHIGRKIGLSDDKGVTVAVLVALAVIASVVVGYYVLFPPPPESYNSLAILDTQQKAIDYPTVLIADKNSTFSVYVNATNHTKDNLNYRVQTKITKNLPANFPNGLQVNPAYTYDFFLQKGKSNQTLVTLTQNEVGSYAVVFELWYESEGVFVFTGNYCLLNIEVIA